MKAMVQDTYGSADVLRLDDVDLPEMGPEDVLVRVRAAGVDAGVWHLMAVSPTWRVRWASARARPRRARGACPRQGRPDRVGRAALIAWL